MSTPNALPLDTAAAPPVDDNQLMAERREKLKALRVQAALLFPTMSNPVTAQKLFLRNTTARPKKSSSRWLSRSMWPAG